MTKDWSQADFLVGDDINSTIATQALQSNCLLFSTNFLVQCLAQEKIVNAGPFILHQTVQRDEARENLPVEDDELGDLVAELELMSSPEATPRSAVASPKQRQKRQPPPPPPSSERPLSGKRGKAALASPEASRRGRDAGAASASKRKGDRQLDELKRAEIVLAEFVDFVPNVNGASVSTVQFRGK